MFCGNVGCFRFFFVLASLEIQFYLETICTLQIHFKKTQISFLKPLQNFIVEVRKLEMMQFIYSIYSFLKLYLSIMLAILICVGVV